MISPITSVDVVRGTSRLLWLQGWSPLPEVTLADGHRADIMAISRTGDILIVEIKVSAADLKGDRKWHHYRDYCDRFAWAVPADLAGHLEDERFAPDACGLLVADRHEALWVREACEAKLAPARRKAVTLAFARAGAERALKGLDPGFEGFWKR
ncbi:MmcB family DNA repair protein [Sandaracinobacter neustonicus]|uniref:MmcB family DNA repair protein n=1 Tax=Sandaracinobacter neustonicus TaxID=1715348 RepID=A0A501XID3_9SPHN|nr:MmcB family DNA repair protein [Sandaracinobacter neustonicus]